MAGYPKMLYGPALMTTSLVTVFTSAGRTKITHIHVNNLNAAAVNVDVRYSNIGSSVAGYLHRLRNIAGSSTADNYMDSYYTDFVLEDGDFILVRCDTATSADVTIFGKIGIP